MTNEASKRNVLLSRSDKKSGNINKGTYAPPALNQRKENPVEIKRVSPKKDMPKKKLNRFGVFEDSDSDESVEEKEGSVEEIKLLVKANTKAKNRKARKNCVLNEEIKIVKPKEEENIIVVEEIIEEQEMKIEKQEEKIFALEVEEEEEAIVMQSPKSETSVLSDRVVMEESINVFGYTCLESELGILSNNIFKWMSTNAYESFMPTQLQMFGSLKDCQTLYVHGTNCGSGKTSGAFIYTMLHMKANDICLVVIDPSKNLTIQHQELIKTLSFNTAKVQTITKKRELTSLRYDSNFIFVESFLYYDVIDAFLNENEDSTSRFLDGDSKIFTIIDEAHKIFNSYEQDIFDVWQVLEEDPTRAKDIPSERLVSKVQDMIRSAISPKLAHFKRGFYLLKNENVKRRILFLTAVGEIGKSDIDGQTKYTTDIIGEMMTTCFGLKQFNVIKSESDAKSTLRHVRVFNMENEGVKQIGGVWIDKLGRECLKTYEAMIYLLMTVLIEGRSLIVCRRSQLKTIMEIFQKNIIAHGSRFLFTTEPSQWNDLKYRYIITCDDNLRFLEGSNIANLKAVYITSIGDSRNFSSIIQAIGRTGRSDQEVSWLFVFADKTSTRNARIESLSQEMLLDIINLDKNNVVKEINVDSKEILIQRHEDLPNIILPSISKEEGLKMAEMVDMRLEVCFRHSCRCLYHHPVKSDYIDGILNNQKFKDKIRVNII